MSKVRKNSQGQVRIIAGKWRGRRLNVLDSHGLRPTTDRIKETIFNWLMGEVAGRSCLDCFSGTGGLGVEALSRYAATVCFLEKDPSVYQQLKKNIVELTAETSAKVILTDSLQWLDKAGYPFDIVFVDPPFRRGLLEKTLFLLENKGWLAENAWIYVECEVELNSHKYHYPVNWKLYREKISGQVSYCLYYREMNVQ